MILFFINDDSGKVRIQIIENAYLKALTFDIREILFGVNNKMTLINGRYLHLLPLVLFFQKGMIGFFLFIFFIGLLFIKIKELRLILLAYIIEGFSFTPLSDPNLSYLIIIFICLKKQLCNNKIRFKYNIRKL